MIVILCLLSISLTGCMNNKANGNLEEKISSEIDYIDAELIKIISKLNNISFSNYIVETKEVDIGTELSTGDDSNTKQEEPNRSSSNSKINVTEMVSQADIDIDTKSIDWKDISFKAEIISDSWNTIVLDLYKSNVKPENINNFSNLINQLLISVENQDKSSALTATASLYGIIPKFISDYSNDAGRLFITTSKWHILNAYVGATIGNWTLSNEELVLAEESFANVMKNEEYMSKKEHNINRAYISIKELQNTNKYANINVFLLKYKSVIQELANI